MRASKLFVAALLVTLPLLGAAPGYTAHRGRGLHATPGRARSAPITTARSARPCRCSRTPAGHGAVTLKPLPGGFPVIVTGPNRDLFRKTSFPFTFAAPGGNTMMTGPMGLIRAAQYRFAAGKS